MMAEFETSFNDSHVPPGMWLLERFQFRNEKRDLFTISASS
jgi:hypothetical protein